MRAQSSTALRGPPRPVRPLPRPAPARSQGPGRASPSSRPHTGRTAAPPSAARGAGSRGRGAPRLRLKSNGNSPPSSTQSLRGPGAAPLPGPKMAPAGRAQSCPNPTWLPGENTRSGPRAPPGTRWLQTRTQDGRRRPRSAKSPQPEPKMAAGSFTVSGAAGIPVRIQDGSPRWLWGWLGGHVTEGGGVDRVPAEAWGTEQGTGTGGGGSGLAPPEQTCRRTGDTAVTTEPANANTAATAASRTGGAGDQPTSLPPPPPRMPRRKVSAAGEPGRHPAGEPASSGRSFFPPSPPPPLPLTGTKLGGK